MPDLIARTRAAAESLASLQQAASPDPWFSHHAIEHTDLPALAKQLADECERLRNLIAEHNRIVNGSCEARAESCVAYTSRGMRCVDCPRDWLIDGVEPKGA